ncbi:MAG TPA: outer membrane beta-barrel protein [Gemmatimonadaceae bacterium]|nr:outer membrane beta-barrel protein [Gemmatimonadaceae bacterium]
MRISKLALVLAFAAAAPLSAQSQGRNGFTLSAGVGSGSAGMTIDGASADSRESSPSGYLRLGTAMSPNLVIAGELNGWSKSESGASMTIGTINAVAQYYPTMMRGLYVLGGAGLGLLHSSAGGTSDNANALGYQVGAGYDWRFTPSFALTPYVGYFATTSAKFSTSGVKASGNVFQFGLGLTWR